MNTVIYLRASTLEQDATRAQGDLEQFAKDNGLTVVDTFVENASGATLARPELTRLLGSIRPGEVLLVESIDRLTRLDANDWDKLKGLLKDKQVKLVVKDIPTTYGNLSTATNEATQAIMQAVNTMLIEILSAMAREDYTKRRERQKQGIAKAKAAGKYKGKPANLEKHKEILQLRKDCPDWSQRKMASVLKCSLGTVNKVLREHEQEGA